MPIVQSTGLAGAVDPLYVVVTATQIPETKFHPSESAKFAAEFAGIGITIAGAVVPNVTEAVLAASKN